LALLDVNALVALAWNRHVHHGAVTAWFDDSPDRAWATCPITEAGFVRVSSNPAAISAAVAVETARSLLSALRDVGGHRFLGNDVSMTDDDMPPIGGHRQVTDALLLTVARRHGVPLVTFDAGLAALARGTEVELLRA
jgi:toxin-antitoxin system PIN domain toxin